MQRSERRRCAAAGTAAGPDAMAVERHKLGRCRPDADARERLAATSPPATENSELDMESAHTAMEPPDELRPVPVTRLAPCPPRRRVRLAIVVSHPIQHFCPQFASWAALDEINLRVFFGSHHGRSSYYDREFGRQVQWDGLRLDFPHEFLSEAKEQHAPPPRDVRAVTNRLVHFGPDCLCVYGYSLGLARRAIAWAGTAGVPVLMVADSELRRRRSWARRAAKALLLPRILRKVDRFLTIGDANEAYYRWYGVPDDRFIRCGLPIDTMLYDRVLEDRERTRAALRAAHGIPHHHEVLLMVGKFTRGKRQEDLVALSNRVRRSRDDVTVVLAGSGAEEQRSRSLAHRLGVGGVVFAGFVQPTRLAQYYCAADVYVHCSAADAHPMAVTEAVYSGLPVVLSDRCGSYGPTDDVRIGVNGCIYACGDIEALESAVADILESSPERRRALAQASARIGREVQRRAQGPALLQAMDSLALRPRNP